MRKKGFHEHIHMKKRKKEKENDFIFLPYFFSFFFFSFCYLKKVQSKIVLFWVISMEKERIIKEINLCYSFLGFLMFDEKVENERRKKKKRKESRVMKNVICYGMFLISF